MTKTHTRKPHPNYRGKVITGRYGIPLYWWDARNCYVTIPDDVDPEDRDLYIPPCPDYDEVTSR